MAAPAVPEKRTSIHRTRELPVLSPARLDAVKPTPAQPLIISVSELSAFLRCRQRWYWSYLARLRRKEDKTPYRSIGIAVHDCLERWYALPPAKRTVKAMTQVYLDVITGTKLAPLKTVESKNRELVKAMVRGYAAWAPEQDKEIGLGVCSPEEEFELPLLEDGSVLVRGKIDNRFESTVKRKTMGCQETKTKSQIDNTVIDLNFQLSTYLWAMSVKYPGFRRYEAFYTVLRRQMPGPRVRSALFGRIAVERTPEEIKRWVLDVQLIVKDMLAPRIYVNPTGSCAWDCDFFQACLLRGSPKDVKYVLKTEFTTEREER